MSSASNCKRGRQNKGDGLWVGREQLAVCVALGGAGTAGHDETACRHALPARNMPVPKDQAERAARGAWKHRLVGWLAALSGRLRRALLLPAAAAAVWVTVRWGPAVLSRCVTVSSGLVWS